MARPYPTNTLQPKGQLEFEELKSGFYRAFFTPPVEAIPKNATDPRAYRRPIFDIDRTNKLLTIYPYQVWGVQPMDSKYYKLFSISLDIDWHGESYDPNVEDIEGFLFDVLPSALVEDYNYGLGFRKNYKPIVNMLEGFGIEKLYLTMKGVTNIDADAKQASIKLADLEKLARNIDGISQRTQRVSAAMKKESTGELFFQLLTNAVPQRSRKMASAELAKRMGKSTRLLPDGATKKEQKDAIEVIKQNSKKIINEQPEALIKLRNDIELVTLEDLIGKFEAMLGKQLPESQWQKLLDENPFILNMAFGIPVRKVRGQASVGGGKFSGAGNKIADYLFSNSITNNAAIVEIKTPATKLINPKEYRGGVFAPSSEVTGAINQMLDQIIMFQTHFHALKADSKEYNLESYAVQGILIAGISLTEPDEQKSFELFRGNSKNIQIVTFDELLRKLKDLRSFLSPASPSTVTTLDKEIIPVDDNELPF